MAVGESTTYVAECGDCGAPAVCDGSEAFVDGRLHWSVAWSCAACGLDGVTCGRSDVPEDLRGRLLADHGPARLELRDLSASPSLIMKVLRAELGLDLAEAKAVLQRVRRGTHTGTPAQMALLAYRLGEAGVQAVVERP